MSIDHDPATLEVRTEDGGMRKSQANTNVVDTKITLFNTGSRNSKVPVVKFTAQRNNPLQSRQLKDYNQVRGNRTNSKHRPQKLTQSLPASRRDPDSELASVKNHGGPNSVTGRISRRSSSTKLPTHPSSSKNRKPPPGKMEMFYG